MTPEEKKEVAKIALKCLLAAGYIFLGISLLCEVLFPKEEEIEEIEEIEEDNPPIIHIMQFRKHEEEEKHDA